MTPFRHSAQLPMRSLTRMPRARHWGLVPAFGGKTTLKETFENELHKSLYGR